MHLRDSLGVSSIDLIPPIADGNTSAWWWLAVMKTARFCDGKPNREFQLGVGCRVVDGKHGGDVDPSKFTWEYVTVNIMVIFCIVAVAYYTCYAGEQLSQTKNAITDFMSRYTAPTRQTPTQGNIVISMPNASISPGNY